MAGFIMAAASSFGVSSMRLLVYARLRVGLPVFRWRVGLIESSSRPKTSKV